MNEELKKNQKYYKNGVFSLEYDKETLRDMVLELQSNWNSLREIISLNRRIYEDSNKSLEDSYKILNCDLPPRYYMNNGCIEMTDYLLDKMNELEKVGDKDE